MSKLRILCAGSEGFVGQHVVNKLLTLGHEVTGVDCLDEQVHKDNPHNQGPCYNDFRGVKAGMFTFLRNKAGNLIPKEGLECDAVIHLGAKVGVGQSMYQIADYVEMNTMDTAKLLQAHSKCPPKRLIVASSMSIYGEGPRKPNYSNGLVDPSFDSAPCFESWGPNLSSIYALTKYDQEQLCLIWGKAYDVPTVALRFFNIYGPGQSLNNPYTGVLAIFASRLLNDKMPVIYEDGNQTRDFIHVDDVANAVVHAATGDMPSGAYNVGTGVATSIISVAKQMAVNLEKHRNLVITREHRKGDIRHCFADISKIKATGWAPKIPFAEGLMEYCAWLQTQPKPEDKFEQAHHELVEKGLTK